MVGSLSCISGTQRVKPTLASGTDMDHEQPAPRQMVPRHRSRNRSGAVAAFTRGRVEIKVFQMISRFLQRGYRAATGIRVGRTPWYTDTRRIRGRAVDAVVKHGLKVVAGAAGRGLYGKVVGKRSGSTKHSKRLRAFGVSGKQFSSVRGKGRVRRPRHRKGIAPNSLVTKSVVKDMIAEALMGSKSTSTYRKKWEMNVLSDQNQAGKDCYIQSCLWYGGNKSASLPAKIRVLSPFQVEEL